MIVNMTKSFTCDGCGTTLPFEQMSSDIMLIHENHIEIDLCEPCTKAVREFLNERMNEKGKGVNTGFSSLPNVSGCSGVGGTWTYTIAGNVPYYTPGKRTPYGSVEDIPTNKPVNTNGEKKKTRRKK